MSRSHSAPTRQLTCTDVRFVQVEFPRQLQPRLVVEFSDGLSLLLEDQTAIPLAVEFIAAFRKQLASKEGRPSEPGQRRIKLHAEALQLLIDGVDLRGATFKPWYERPD